MPVRKTLSIAAAAVLIGLLLGSTVFSPGAATAQEEEAATRPNPEGRWEEILAPLVEDGTISSEQAAAVAAHLAGNLPKGHFIGRGLGLTSMATAADIIGIEGSELRQGLADGSTLAEIAEANGVETQTLIDGLLAALEEKLDGAIASGRLTEDVAVEILENAPERIENFVTSEVHPRRGFWLTPGDRPAFDEEPDA